MPADQAAAACEKAWENWKLSKKALDYTPDILSMGLASLAQAYVVNKFIFQKAMQPFLNQAPGIAHAAAQKAGVKVATTEVVTNYLGERAVLPLDPKNYSARVIKKGAERYVTLVLRGFRFAGALGEALSGTGGRILTSAVNIAIFMEIVHPITPMIKQPFERRRQGTDITSTTNELISEIANKWYVDELYDKVIVRPLHQLGGFFKSVFEVSVIDTLVNGVGKVVNYGSRQLRLLQSGQVGSYVLLMVLSMIEIFAVQFFIRK